MTIFQFLSSTIGGAARQCVTLMNQWLGAKGLPAIGGNAINWQGSSAFVPFTGKNRPSAGDVLVLGPKGGNLDLVDSVGHVAAYLGTAKNGLVNAYGANFGKGSNLGAGLSPARETLHWSDVLGWVSLGKDELQRDPTAAGFASTPAFSRWSLFLQAAKKNSIDPLLLAAVSLEESGGGRTSLTYLGYGGGSGSKGTPQARYAGWKNQVNGAAQLLHSLIAKYGLQDGVAAYNAGPGNIAGGQSYASSVLGIRSQLAKASDAFGGAKGSAPSVPFWQQIINAPGYLLAPLLGSAESLPGAVGSAASGATGDLAGAIGTGIAGAGLALGHSLLAWVKKDGWQFIIGGICIFLGIGAARNIARGGQGGDTRIVPVPV